MGPMTERAADPPGLQRERTALAWNRTGLAVVLTGALLARPSASGHWDTVVGTGFMGIGGMLLLVAASRYRRWNASPADTPVAAAPLLGVVCGLVTAFSLIILVATVVWVLEVARGRTALL